MNEHKFSNQKSALEDYFESLLAEDDQVESTVISDHPETLVGAEQRAEQLADQTVVEDTVKAVTADEPIINEVPEITEPVTEAVKETQRTSIEEMLAAVEEKVEPVAEPLAEFAEPEPAISIPLPAVAPPVVETVTETVVEATVEEEVVVDQAVAEAPAVVEETVREVTVPEWAESPFQCLLFKVGGLSLAVPLVRLNGVIPWSENVVETPNQTDWYLGVLMNHGNKVQVIDTAVMVLPAEHRAGMPDAPEERFSHILLVDDQRWGLACDSIGDVVWLKQDDVKWRSNKTKRPWLMGTAIEHMCAVMDTEAFADMLEEQK